MIIGINGKIGSGKDTVGKIIQWLTKPELDSQYIGFQTYDDATLERLSPFTIKKFAGKLKQIASLLTGIPVEKFENQEFKNTELGEEWWYIKKWYPANPNKNKVFTLYPYIEFDSRIFDGDDSCMWEVIKTTPRLLLQLLGTECGRDIIHPNIWVNSLFADYKADNLAYHHAYTKENVNYGLQTLEFPNWIITDMRFPNEMEAVVEKGGITIRVVRPHGYINPHTGEYKEMPLSYHSSETALDDAEFDYEILNDGTIEDLIEKVRTILIKEKII